MLTGARPTLSLPGTPAPAAQRRQAATALEFAIVAPILFTIVLGIIELGRGIMVIHNLTNAARVGARVGAIEGTSSATITNDVNANLAACGISGATVTVLVNQAAQDALTAQAGDEVTVKVTVPTGNVSWLPGAMYVSGTLGGQYTLRRE